MQTRTVRLATALAIIVTAVGAVLAIARLTTPASSALIRTSVSATASANPSTELLPSTSPTDSPPNRGHITVHGFPPNAATPPKFNATISQENRKLTVLISKSEAGKNCTISKVEIGYPDAKLPKPQGAEDNGGEVVGGSGVYTFDYSKVEGKAEVKVKVTVIYRCQGDTEDQKVTMTYQFNLPADPKDQPTVVLP